MVWEGFCACQNLRGACPKPCGAVTFATELSRHFWSPFSGPRTVIGLFLGSFQSKIALAAAFAIFSLPASDFRALTPPGRSFIFQPCLRTCRKSWSQPMTQDAQIGKKTSKTASMVTYGPLRMPKRAESRPEFDGDDESS